MTQTNDILRVVTTVESLLPVVVGLIRDLHDLISGAGRKSVAEILAEADARWQAVLASSRQELSAPGAPHRS